MVSGAICIAPFLALVTATCISVFVREGAWRMGVESAWWLIGWRLPLAAFAVSLFLHFLCLPYWLPASLRHSAAGVSPQTANARLACFEVPANATNVDFHRGLYDALTEGADFDLTEADFLAWMAAEKRQPARFTMSAQGVEWADGKARSRPSWIEVTPVALLFKPGNNRLRIARGYYFDDYGLRGHDDGLTIVYDLDRRRVFIWRTTY